MRKIYNSQPAGYLFGKVSLTVLAIVLGWSAWNQQLGIFVLVSLTLSAGIFTNFWANLSLKRVGVGRVLSETHVFPGEEIELKLQVSNRKPMPLTWIQVEDEVPQALVSKLTLFPGSRPGFRILRGTASLLWYSKAAWRSRFSFKKRGFYPFGPLRVTSGDLFGFYSRSLEFPGIEHVTVFPRIYSIDRFHIPSQHPLGETKAERNIFQDPTRIIGLRDYTPYDSLRYVHWKASARRQELQVKVFEPTTTLKAALFLFADVFQTDDMEDSLFEFAVSLAASISAVLIEQKSLVGLYANGLQVDSGQPVNLPPGQTHQQLFDILEALAKLGSNTNESFQLFFRQEQKKIPWGTTVVFILPGITDDLSEFLNGLAEEGYTVVVLYIGASYETEPGDSFESYRVSRPDETGKIAFERVQ